MWMHALLLLLPDKELAVMVSDSISMTVLLTVGTLRPLGSNFLELMGKKKWVLKKEPPAYFFFLLLKGDYFQKWLRQE